MGLSDSAVVMHLSDRHRWLGTGDVIFFTKKNDEVVIREKSATNR
jgi:hypothetical protein